MVAIAVDATIGGCAMLIALMLASRRSLTQIRTMLADADVEPLALPLVAMAAVGAVLPFLFAISVARQGATPGKALMSLTVRDVATGRFPAYARALGREALRFLHVGAILFLGDAQIIGIVLAAIVLFDMSRSRLTQTWYDRALQTVIVAPSSDPE